MGANESVVDIYVARANAVHAIAVKATANAADAIHLDMIAIEDRHVPVGGIAEGDTFNLDVARMRKADEVERRMRELCAVEYAATADCDILEIADGNDCSAIIDEVEHASLDPFDAGGENAADKCLRMEVECLATLE